METTLAGLEKIAPSDPAKLGERIRMRIGTLIRPEKPSREAILAQENVQANIHQTEIFQRCEDEATRERSISRELSEVKNSRLTKTEELKGVKGDVLKTVDLFLKMLESPEAIDPAGVEAVGPEVVQESLTEMKNLIDLHRDETRLDRLIKMSRGELPKLPLEEDLKMFEPVWVSEKNVLCLEYDLRKGMDNLRGFPNDKIDTGLLNALMAVSVDYRGTAVGVMTEMKVQEKAIKLVAQRLSQRNPDIKRADVTNDFEKYLADKKLLMSPEIKTEMPARDVEAEVAQLRTRMASEFGITDEKLVNKTLDALGFKPEGSRWISSGDGLWLATQFRQEEYKAAITAMHETRKNAENDSDQIVASYLAVNMAIVSGGALLKLENTQKQILMNVGAEQMKLTISRMSELGDKQKEAMKMLDAVTQKGALETVAGVMKQVSGWVEAKAAWVNEYSAGIERSEAAKREEKDKTDMESLKRNMEEMRLELEKLKSQNANGTQ